MKSVNRVGSTDLAGSERVAFTHSVGKRREEGLTINQSLLTPGRVITVFEGQSFVPYRCEEKHILFLQEKFKSRK